MSRPFIRVLGSADWHHAKRNDPSCYTVSDRILADACSNVVKNLPEYEVSFSMSNELCLHSSVYEAVQVCQEANARRLS